ncbi:MAG: methyl-accepting chemotaxis protein [Deltaproteobacteria bacterium]|jgi:PAS domain S-box-containing protein|nr:methyl-accepting chemotaxis protein [Deltaproteobacteria bacterium]
MLNPNRRVFSYAVVYRVLFFMVGGTILWWALGEKDLTRTLLQVLTLFILSEISIYFFTRNRLKMQRVDFDIPFDDAADEVEGLSFRALPDAPAGKALPVKSNEPGSVPSSSLLAEQMELQKNAEQEKEFFQKILDSATLYSFIVISMDGKVQSWNSGAENLFGWNKQEAVGRPVSFTFVKDDSSEAVQIQRKRSKQVMTQGKAIFNMLRMRKNGELFPMHCTVTALKDQSGRLEGFLEIGRDLTTDVKKDQALKEQIQTARNLAKSLKKIVGIVKSIEVISLQTNILALNAAVEAAHAGEAGEGFSVISGEMKNLSNNSRSAAQEIGQLVEEIKRESSKITETEIDWIEI